MSSTSTPRQQHHRHHQRQTLATCVCIADVERCAMAGLPKTIRDYYRSGADDERTLVRNVVAFRRLLGL